eukprot:4663423-Pleurochrysis_carterae.AAC.11
MQVGPGPLRDFPCVGSHAGGQAEALLHRTGARRHADPLTRRLHRIASGAIRRWWARVPAWLWRCIIADDAAA